MEFSVKSAHPQKQRTACIITGVFEPRRLSESADQLNSISGDAISNIIRRGDLEGKLKQTLLLHNVPNVMSDRILLVGCGKEKALNHKQFTDVIQKTIRTLNETGSMEAVCFLTELNVKSRDIYWKVRQAVQITLETLYSFDAFKSKKDTARRSLRRLTFTVPTKGDLQVGEIAILHGMAIAEAANFTKDLANTPPNICNPAYLAKQAENLAKEHSTLSCEVFETKKIQSLKMNALLAVAQGSDAPPKLITLSYTGSATKDLKPIIFVGKGVTFDTGGNSLKPPKSMIGMKYDMCGAATVLGVLLACVRLQLPLNVIGIIPAVENMPGAKAARPDDIVTTMSGKTVEILNTDAEGRLILCDALTYCERFKPDTVIDIATLTGACIIALGHHASAVYSNHKALAQDLLNAGRFSQDYCWKMPLWEEYNEQLKSNFADLCNIADGGAGSVTAACFLANFTQQYHWAHLDVAGTAGYFAGNKRGASGRPVPLLIEYLLERVKAQA